MIRKYLSSDRVAVRSKLAQKYDKTAESDVINWIKTLTGVELEAGIYKLARQLKNGQTLVKLAQKIQEGTPECPEAAKNFQLKLNTDNAPFKQMENIQVFLGFCEHYGVPVSGLFHTKDLFDGNNMQQVLACVIQLGTESQRNHFEGVTIGPKPQEKNIRDFSEEKLKASHSFLTMQAGKSGQALDFQIGAARRIVDSRTEGGKTGKTPEVVNGVPDLLDIGKKGKRKDKEGKKEKKESESEERGEEGEEKEEGEEEEEVSKDQTKKDVQSDKKKEKSETKKAPEKVENGKKEASDDEKKEKSPAPVVKSKPKKKEEENSSERKPRKKEKTQEKETSDKKEKKEKKKKSSDTEEEEEE